AVATNGSRSMALTRSRGMWGTVLPFQSAPIQRILMVTDGTVTEILEAYAGESMRVVKLDERMVVLTPPEPALEVTGRDPILRRRFLLKGSASQVSFLYAESLIALARLSMQMRDGLLSSRKPIGYLLQEHRLETFREILTGGRERAGLLATHFRLEPDAWL